MGEVTDRKLKQLCSQVRRTLSQFLVHEVHDELLQSLFIEDVVPAPGAGHMLVTLSVPAELEVDKKDLLLRLENTKGALRSELARAIRRRKVPDLSFLLVKQPG